MRTRASNLARTVKILALLGALPLKAAFGAQGGGWDYWYTITLTNGTRVQYYNDKVERKGDRVHFQNHVWKKEEGFINEEHLGAVAVDNAALTPVFFNYRSLFRSSETVIDGNVSDGKILSVKARRVNGGNSQDLPAVKRGIPSTVFLSSFFPVWLGKQLSSLKPGIPKSFNTIIEDNLDQGFSLVTGTVKLDTPDEFAAKTRTQKLRVNYRGVPSTWWVESSGAAVRIEFPNQLSIVQRVTADQARKFLN